MSKILFSRTNTQGQVINFECCVASALTEVKTPKEMYDEESGVWLKIEKNGCHVFYIYKGLEKEIHYPSFVKLKIDRLPLTPNMESETEGVNPQYRKTELMWNESTLLNYLAPIPFTQIEESKRAINGILEKEFECLIPIFNPTGMQEPVISEVEMYPIAIAFRAMLDSL